MSGNAGIKRKIFVAIMATLWGVFPSCAAEISDRDGGWPYGLKGDGQSDDTAALQAAIQAQKRITLPQGRYRITGSLVLDAGCGIAGSGTLDVDFDTLQADGSNAALRCQGSNIRIEGIKIAKRFVDGSYGIGILLGGQGHKDIRIHGVDISGYSARYGIHLVECEDFEISNSHIHDFMMDSSADMIRDSPAGIRVTRSRRGVISNNRIFRIEVGSGGRVSASPMVPKYGKQGYQSDLMTVVACREIAITGNSLATSGEGIDLLLSQECTVAGNTIRDIWFQGIKMLGVSFTTISGNVIRDCYQGVGLADHAQFHSDCCGNAISGNTILDSGSAGSFGVPGPGRVRYGVPAGVDVHDASDYNVITGNVIMDTQAVKTMKAAIAANSAQHNVIANNVEDSAYTRPARNSEGSSGSND